MESSVVRFWTGGEWELSPEFYGVTVVTAWDTLKSL